MSTFDDREKGFEAKYAHDKDLLFRITARRNKLLGLWAAELMGMTGEDAAAYAKEVVQADFEEAGHEDVVRKVKGDLDAKGVDKSDHQIRVQMEELLVTARDQVMQEVK